MIFIALINRAWPMNRPMAWENSQHASEEEAHVHIERKLEELYPGQWEQNNSFQYVGHDSAAGEPVMAVIKVRHSNDPEPTRPLKVFTFGTDLAVIAYDEKEARKTADIPAHWVVDDVRDAQGCIFGVRVDRWDDAYLTVRSSRADD